MGCATLMVACLDKYPIMLYNMSLEVMGMKTVPVEPGQIAWEKNSGGDILLVQAVTLEDGRVTLTWIGSNGNTPTSLLSSDKWGNGQV